MYWATLLAGYTLVHAFNLPVRPRSNTAG